MNYIKDYAEHYSIDVVSLEAATIELACNFYDPKFGFKFDDENLDCESLRRPRLRTNKTKNPLARFNNNRMFDMSIKPELSRKLMKSKTSY